MYVYALFLYILNAYYQNMSCLASGICQKEEENSKRIVRQRKAERFISGNWRIIREAQELQQSPQMVHQKLGNLQINRKLGGRLAYLHKLSQ